jgi:hypothetical protein
LTPCGSEVTDTTSVGPSAAPRARANHNGTVGISELIVNPIHNVKTNTNPIANDNIENLFLIKELTLASLASLYRIGPTKNTMKTSVELKIDSFISKTKDTIMPKVT